MKKIILTLALIVFGLVTFAQEYGVVYTIAAPTSKTQFNIGKNNLLYVTSTKGLYNILANLPAGTLGSTAIANTAILYPVGAAVAATATITSLTCTTAGITTAGIATATITSGTLTTGILGGKALTTKNTNGGTYAGSLTLATGDTLIAPKVSADQIIATNDLLSDTVKFGTDAAGNRNKYIRRKITGITATDIFVVSPVMATTVAIPGAGEWLGWYCTTDSLIISRNTATTAGMAVSYIRIKK